METRIMEAKYQQATNLINNLIPEKWEKVYLYAEVNEESKRVFFYYYPKGKGAPIYYLDMKNYFTLDEDVFRKLRGQITETFKELWLEFKQNKQEEWTNLTFILENSGQFKLEYGYEDILEVDNYEHHVIWKYKYLGLRTDGDRAVKIVENYLNDLEG